YNGNAVTFQNETGSQWKRTTDALGRLTQVMEPSATSPVPSMETDYQYNTLNDLTRVDQWGGPNGSAGDRVRTFTYDSLSRLTSSSNPETGPVAYHYDNNGNLSSRVDARNITTSYTYDALNRMKSKQAPGISYGYTYDSSQVGTGGAFTSSNPIGHLVEASNGVNASEQFSYDSMGRIVYQAACLPDYCTQTGNAFYAGYDLAGDLTSLTYPDGRVLAESYDGAQHLTGIQYANWNGTTVGYNYLASATYDSDGSPQSLTYGNGAIDAYLWSKRLQPTESAVQTSVGGSLQTVYDKHYCYGPADSRGCGATGADNGNILSALDMLGNAHSQGYSYDDLNRLVAFSTGDNTMAQTFSYDPWGNMTQAGTETFQVQYAANNRIAASGFIYDAAGNMTQTDFGIPQAYAYDAEGRITNYNNGAATYTYDGEGQRVRKDSAGSWTEYVYFNGQPLAEKNSDGSWSDYVYAGGERLARADSYDERIHTSGTSTVAASYAAWYLPFATYVIKSGDKISWRQYQTVKGGGMGIGFSDGTNTNWTAARDTDGQEMNNDGTVGSWHNRTVDLTAFAGKTATKLWVASSTATPVGSWNIYYGDIAIHSADGTVTTIYERGPSEGFSYWTGGGETNPQAIVERTNTAGDAETPGTTTTYYVADQINSARMMLTAGGWPVSMDTYYPSGTEAYPPGDANHY